MKTVQKKAMEVLCAFTLVFGSAMPAHAAISVIDLKNIQQQLNTYNETIKVVTNTAKTLELVILDHMGMSKEEQEKFQKKFDNGIKRVNDIMSGDMAGIFGKTSKKSGVFDETIDGKSQLEIAQELLKTDFPELWDENTGGCFGTGKTSTIEATYKIWQAARNKSLSSLMENNQGTLGKYAQLMTELDGCMKDLQDLQEASANAQGIMQAQQIANDIQTVNARIDTIRTNITALKGQNDVMQNQADAQMKKNDIQMAEATHQANVKAGKTILDNASPVVNQKEYNPWAKY